MNNYEKWLNGEISDSDLNHRQYGAFQERSRIIKLLEDNKITYHLVSIEGEILNATAPLAAPLDKVIALIKGKK